MICKKLAITAWGILLTTLLIVSAAARDASDYTDSELLSAGWSTQQIKELRESSKLANSSQDESIHIDHYCGYFDSKNPGSIHPFRAESRVEALIDEVMEITGLPRNFEVIAGGVPNAAALMIGEKRVIAYNQTFLYDVEQAIQNRWPAYSIMAHEIGHHLAGHALTNVGSRPATELEADKYSGFAMQRLGASLKEAQMVMQLIGTDNGTVTHPPRRDRLAAIASGWLEECNRDANCGVQEDSSKSRTSADPAATPSVERIKPNTDLSVETIEPNSENAQTERSEFFRINSGDFCLLQYAIRKYPEECSLAKKAVKKKLLKVYSEGSCLNHRNAIQNNRGEKIITIYRDGCEKSLRMWATTTEHVLLQNPAISMSATSTSEFNNKLFVDGVVPEKSELMRENAEWHAADFIRGVEDYSKITDYFEFEY